MVNTLIALVLSSQVHATVPGANLRIAAPGSVGLYLQTEYDPDLGRLRFEECFHGNQHCVPIGQPRGYDVERIARRLTELASYRETLARNRRRQTWVASVAFTGIAAAIGAESHIVAGQPLFYAGIVGVSISSFFYALIRDSEVILVDRRHLLKKAAGLRDYFDPDVADTFSCASEAEYRQAVNLVTKFISLLNVDDKFCQKLLR